MDHTQLPTVLTLAWLREAYLSGRFSVAEVMVALQARIDAHDQPQAWITRLSREAIAAYVDRLAGVDPASLPLYGIPFAIKDNIDLAGVATTAACPDYAYVPERDASAVAALIAAGAIPLGKTNLDQFATGLVGTRSPYGVCHGVFSEQHISGGSSAGSAVVVAAGLACFALGTDTAGSGRVPAAFNNLVGWKPSRGLVSSRGVVPACRSLDCISVFALSAADAEQVAGVIAQPDSEDAYSRRFLPAGWPTSQWRLAVPRPEQLQWFGDAEQGAAWARLLQALRDQGHALQEIDYTPFSEAAALLYEGPWVAERHAAVGDFIEAQPEAALPVIRQIIGGGKAPTARSLFQAEYRRRALEAQTQQLLADFDALLLPTAPRYYTLSELEADPFEPNRRLGTYNNFMNLLDMAGVAVPAGFRGDGLPFGVTLAQVAGRDAVLLRMAGELHRHLACGLGVDRAAAIPAAPAGRPAADAVKIAVCGAHLSGLPLNRQLTERGGVLLGTARTAANYKLYALPNTTPPKPGLVCVPDSDGPGIEVEIWALPAHTVGSFLAGIPAPLGIGSLQLKDGRYVQGFVCEAWAVAEALDITAFGGWRAWLQQR